MRSLPMWYEMFNYRVQQQASLVMQQKIRRKLNTVSITLKINNVPQDFILNPGYFNMFTNIAYREKRSEIAKSADDTVV